MKSRGTISSWEIIEGQLIFLKIERMWAHGRFMQSCFQCKSTCKGLWENESQACHMGQIETRIQDDIPWMVGTELKLNLKSNLMIYPMRSGTIRAQDQPFQVLQLFLHGLLLHLCIKSRTVLHSAINFYLHYTIALKSQKAKHSMCTNYRSADSKNSQLMLWGDTIHAGIEGSITCVSLSCITRFKTLKQ